MQEHRGNKPGDVNFQVVYPWVFLRLVWVIVDQVDQTHLETEAEDRFQHQVSMQNWVIGVNHSQVSVAVDILSQLKWHFLSLFGVRVWVQVENLRVGQTESEFIINSHLSVALDIAC
jgi:hypothetical protein